jgi:hypothetical protein
MIAIVARLLAVSLAVTLAALFVVAFFAPPAQAQSMADRPIAQAVAGTLR